METPIPFDEHEVKQFWEYEDWDKLLPSPGFITDFVLATRGLTTPTKFCIWSALFTISSVVRRDAELDWKPLRFFPNLYVFLVGPPCFTGKSTIIDHYIDKLLTSFHKHIKDPIEREKKKIRNKITSSCTPEALINGLARRVIHPRDAKGAMQDVKIGSECCIVTGELSTFLGKQQYNAGLIQKLTSLYDCKENDRAITLSRTKDELEDIYVTLIGGMTQSGLENSIAEAALEEGFLSRVIIISQPEPTRDYSMPLTVEGGPAIEDLQKRLAWISLNAKGIYTPSAKVKRAYDRWYRKFISLYAKGSMPRGCERHGKHLLKLAMLIRMNRYKPGTVIEMEDYMTARRMIDALQQDTEEATSMLGAGVTLRAMSVVRKYIKKRGTVARRDIRKSLSARGILTDTMDAALRELMANGEITVLLKGKVRRYPGDIDEHYEWKGDI